jgi:hypothetical protein
LVLVIGLVFAPTDWFNDASGLRLAAYGRAA